MKSAHKTISIIFSLIALPLAINSYAAENNLEEVHINADKMHFDLNSNTSIYEGNVTILKGAVELKGSHVEIQQNNNVISTIIASGNPAQFTQTDSDGNDMHAQSKLIKYFADEDKLIMIDDAKLVQNTQVIESSHITYDTKEQALIAGDKATEADSNQRVKMTLTPDTNK